MITLGEADEKPARAQKVPPPPAAVDRAKETTELFRPATFFNNDSRHDNDQLEF